jgi:hypothetical protein
LSIQIIDKSCLDIWANSRAISTSWAIKPVWKRPEVPLLYLKITGFSASKKVS